MTLYEVVKVYEVEAVDEEEAKKKIVEMEVLGKQCPRDAQRDTSKRAVKTSFEDKEKGEKRDT